MVQNNASLKSKLYIDMQFNLKLKVEFEDLKV